MAYSVSSIIVSDAVIQTATHSLKNIFLEHFRIKCFCRVGKTSYSGMIIRLADCRNVTLPHLEGFKIDDSVYRGFSQSTKADAVKPYRAVARLVLPPPFDPGYTFHIID